MLGNIREVSTQELKNDSYYMQGDYTGDLGVEKSYETYLRGEKGQEVFCGMLMGVSRDVMKTERSIAKPFPEKILRWRSIWSCNSMANN